MRFGSFSAMSRCRLLAPAFFALLITAAAEPVQLVQTPALSPDGGTLVFGWRGDLWSVPSQGGEARRLTEHPAIDSTPLFSPDGKQIAFLSERQDGRQIHLMPAAGGVPRQLTWHSEGYDLAGWTPDGRQLLVTLVRDHSWMRGSRSARLALVEVQQRQAEQVLLDDAAAEASLSPDGHEILFVREGESWWRQGYRGARAGQIWLLNRADGSCRQVLTGETENRFPLWKPDGSGFYYTRNRDGAFNLCEHDFANSQSRQITAFKTDSVVFPALSKDGSTLVFRHRVDLYRWQPGQDMAPEKIRIEHQGDPADRPIERRVLERATRIAFTADGLQMAFLADADVWVMDTELREPRQVTHTPEEERDLVFAPDGKSLWFVSDQGGQADLWKAVPASPAQAWWENRAFKLEKITDDPAVESGLQFSPDGKRLVWLKERGDFWLADADGKNARRLFASWNKPSFSFSPDGQWLAYAQSDEWFNSDIWLLPLDGSKAPFNLSRHPDNDEAPAWSPEGRLLAWTGRRDNEEVDIHYVWLRAQDDEQSSRERTLIKAREKLTKANPKAQGSPKAENPKAQASAPPPAKTEPQAEPKAQAAATPKEAEKPAAKAEPKAAPKVAAKPLPMDLEDIHERIRRIRLPNTAEAGLAWSPDSRKLAFIATIDGKRGTYTLEFPDELKPKLLAAATLTDMRWLKQGNQLVGLSEGLPAALSATGSLSTWRFRALQATDRAGRQRAVFDLCWRVMRDHYYDERLGNRDWNAVHAKYADLAATAPDLRAVQELVHLMLGELNGSHLGFMLDATATGVPPAPAWREETAHLGLRFDPGHAGPGWKVRDVLPKGPASHRLRRILPGELILRIDGRETRPGQDVSELLNGPLERDIALHVRATDGKEREVSLRPISYTAARGLLYEQWIKANRARVEQDSGGRLGYLHISAMDSVSFHKFQEELYASGAGRDGLIIDVRENGGGSTTDHLLTALTQPRHALTVPRGGDRPGYPQDRMIYATWDKPVTVLCNQNSYSNAEIFSHAIRLLKRGQVVGTPTAGGVISTGSARILDVGSLRLPFRGWYGLESGIDMELNGAQPHHVIWPEPGDTAKGIDRQLTKGIEVLKAEVEARAKRKLPLLRKASERFGGAD